MAGGPAHNTGARCEDGLQTGTTAGAPDLMFDEAPELEPRLPAGRAADVRLRESTPSPRSAARRTPAC